MTGDWPRPVVHWEIRARDPERLRAFYSELFNWEIGDGPIMSIPPGVGPPEDGAAGHIIQNERTGVTLYVQVRDLSASMGRVTELGGKVLGDKFDVPGGPTLCSVRDPEDNPLMLVQQ